MKTSIKSADMSEVAPGVFVGGWSASRDFGAEFDTIVNCAADAPDSGSHRRFDLVDGPGNDRALMQAAVDFVVGAIRDGDRILVHCVAGRSRSVTVVAAALSCIRGVPLESVIAEIGPMRGCDGLNQPHPALVELAHNASTITAGRGGFMPYASETSKHRVIFDPYVQGNGVDVGFGGDPIRPSAITIDTDPHADCGNHPINIVGDATSLPWFGNGTLSYVFSSHCLEDFEDTESALRDWLRVLMPGGYLCLLLPDQKKYIAHCRLNGTQPNGAHKHATFGLAYVRDVLRRIGGTEIVYENGALDAYNIALVARKV